jgi:type IV pilus assembly protein PilW
MLRPLAHKGFGLIEIMVGLAIGLIATIIMFQTFAVSERHKRTTTGAADAQTNGAIGMFSIERDVKMAGWGFDMAELANCSSFYSWHETETPPSISLFASVLITDGGDGPDSVRIQYFGDPSETNLKFSKTRIAKTMPTPSSVYEVDSPYGCTPKVGGPPLFAIVSQAGKGCTLAQITGVNGSDKLMHEKGVTAPYNPAANDSAGWPTYTAESDPALVASVQCFSGLYSRTYQIASKQLELTQPDATGAMVTTAVAPEILDMQARYGVALAGTQAINEWVKATGDWSPATLTMANIRRIKAVQIALLARSAAYEKPENGTTCTATTVENAASWPTWAGFKTSQLPTDWQCYRYKVFELTVPLRNIIWAKT